MKLFLLALLLVSNYCSASCEVVTDYAVDKNFEASLEGLCNRLAMQDGKFINYKIVLPDKDKEVNAYAYQKDIYSVIYITNPLLKEHGYDTRLLAFVVGHEMAHHSLGHVKETRLSKIMDRVKLGVLSAIGIDAVGPSTLTKFYVQSFEKHFNRQQELAADKYSLFLITKAGYRKEDALDSLDIMLRLSDDSKWKDFFSNHPDTRSRIKNIQLN